MKTIIAIITAIVLGLSSVNLQAFTSCYSASAEKTEIMCACTHDGCMFATFTPYCTFCIDYWPAWTGKNCYQEGSYTSKVQAYGPSDETDTKCVFGVCTGGVKYGKAYDDLCYYTTESLCGG